MNWHDATPWLSLALSLGTVAFFAGSFWAKSGATDTAVATLKADMAASAKGQGERIGKVEDAVAVLFDHKARSEGASLERDRSGIVRNRP